MDDETMLLSAAYGPPSPFALELELGGRFTFALAGNSLPLFPSAEVGRWRGEDAGSVQRLRDALRRAAEQAPSVPLDEPDDPYWALRHPQGDVAHTYPLYHGPAPWQQATALVMQQVNGAWLGARDTTLLVTANPPVSPSRSQEAVELTLQMQNSGPQALTLVEALARERWWVRVVPHHLTAEQLELYPIELADPEVTVLGAQSGHEITLDAGAHLDVRLNVTRPLSVGHYRLELGVVVELRGDQFHRLGEVSLQPGPLEKQA